jgi:hypothetical protein
VQKSRRTYRPIEPDYYRPLRQTRPRSRFLRTIPYVAGGAMLVVSFAFAGHYMGQKAIAHNVDVVEPLDASVSAPVSTIVQKHGLLEQSSLAPSGVTLDLKTLPLIGEQEVVAKLKGDFIDRGPVEPAVSAPKPVQKRLAMTPPVWKLESTFKLKREEKQKIVAQRRIRLAEENCLAKAVYFEARSETEIGQLAVAKVILNRVKDPEYPKTICGVVYQGSDRRNSCQFSFACDGMPDDVKSRPAWDRSKRIAQKALAGDQTVRIMGAATHYHADYVRPSWSRDMRRLIKIGRHIFYSDS